MLFSEWIRKTGRTQRYVARRIGVSGTYLSLLISWTDTGESTHIRKGISPRLAAAIVRLTDGAVSLEEALFPRGMPPAEELLHPEGE